MSIWFPIFNTLFSMFLWIVVWAQEDDDMKAFFIAATLGGPVVVPILTAITWYLYLN